MNANKQSEIKKKDLILTDNNGNKLHFNSLCKSLKHSKLGMSDIKELTNVILKSLKKMSYKEKIFKNNNKENNPEDLSETLESIYKSKSINYSNNNYNSVSSFLSTETPSKSNPKGYDADVSKSINNNNNYNNNDEDEENSDKLRIDFKSHLQENYFQRKFNPNYHRLSNFISQQNVSNRFENTDTNKTSSSGVFSESPVENSDFDTESDLEVVTRIIEDSYNIDNIEYNGSDSDCNTQIDDLYEYSNSSCESEYTGVETQTNANHQTFNYSNISDSHSDILNRSATSWLSQCKNGCDCSKCYIDCLIRKAEISYLNEQTSNSSSFSYLHRSSTPFHRAKRSYLNEILSTGSSRLLGDRSSSISSSSSLTSSSVLHCSGNDLCLICMQNSRQEQSVGNRL